MSCDNGQNDPNTLNWDQASADDNIRMIINGGGVDDNGLFWLGQSGVGTFSQSLGKQFTRIPDYECSLEQPCNHELFCDEIGARSTWNADNVDQAKAGLSGTSVYFKSRWGFFTLIALQNLNRQLTNQYVAIKDALGVLTLDTFLIGDFFPTPDGQLNIVNALTGLGTIFSVLSGSYPL